jgi:hypothetical protein
MAILGKNVPILRESVGDAAARSPSAEALVDGLVGAGGRAVQRPLLPL